MVAKVVEVMCQYYGKGFGCDLNHWSSSFFDCMNKKFNFFNLSVISYLKQ
jgi:hypothetical protein